MTKNKFDKAVIILQLSAAICVVISTCSDTDETLLRKAATVFNFAYKVVQVAQRSRKKY